MWMLMSGRKEPQRQSTSLLYKGVMEARDTYTGQQSDVSTQHRQGFKALLPSFKHIPLCSAKLCFRRPLLAPSLHYLEKR